MADNLSFVRAYTNEAGNTRRVVYRIGELPSEQFLVVKLFGGNPADDDAPVTFKFWRTTDLQRTVKHWSCRTPLTRGSEGEERAVEESYALIQRHLLPMLENMFKGDR
uniref:Uncharacterized protein n=1 Tax=viral metagenome TaxID=1070528 RepID=A0A2V0RHW7_9ZZZZ